MAENTSLFSCFGSQRLSPRVVVSILLLAGLFAGLIGYKARGGLKRINAGGLLLGYISSTGRHQDGDTWQLPNKLLSIVR
jgi:uncharacterized YccA/Bax inhibitor family protein